GLPLRHHPAALLAFAVTPAAVIEAETGISGGTELFEHHDVVLGIFEAEESGPLNNAGVRFALIRIGQIETAADLNDRAIEIPFFGAHKYSRFNHCVRFNRSLIPNR